MLILKLTGEVDTEGPIKYQNDFKRLQCGLKCGYVLHAVMFNISARLTCLPEIC